MDVDVLEGRTSPDNMETPARQKRDLVPPGAPRKRKQRRELQRKLQPKKLQYHSGPDEEGVPKEKLYELLDARINNSEGTWVQCCQASCGKWRYLQEVADPNEVPNKWYCAMNKDTRYKSCTAAEQDYSQEEFVDAKFFVGSIVWAKLATYPWWPAMIDDDPDNCVYFFNEDPYDEDRVVPKQYERGFNDAVKSAQLAIELPISERTAQYCFINNYPPLMKASLRQTSIKRKQPRNKYPNGKTTTKQPTSDSQPAKRPRGRPPKARTATEEQTQQMQPARRPKARPPKVQVATEEPMQQTVSESAATTSQARAPKSAPKGAKGKTSPRSSPRPKIQSATQAMKKIQERKFATAYKKSVQEQEPTSSSPSKLQSKTAPHESQAPAQDPAAIPVNCPPDASQPPKTRPEAEKRGPLSTIEYNSTYNKLKKFIATSKQSSAMEQPKPQSKAHVLVEARKNASDAPLVQSLVGVPASHPSNGDKQSKTCAEAENQELPSPAQVSQDEVGEARKPSYVPEKQKPETMALATELQDGTPTSSETPLVFTEEQTQWNLEDVADVNDLIEFLDEDIDNDRRLNNMTGFTSTSLPEAETEMVPASVATASGGLLSQLVIKDSASVPLFGEALCSEQNKSATSDEIWGSTDLAPVVPPKKRAKQSVPISYKENMPSEDKNKTSSKAKKTKNLGTEKAVVDSAAQPSNDSATQAKPAKVPAKTAGKVRASMKLSMPQTKTIDKAVAPVPPKPVATAPAQAATAPLKETKVVAKPAVETGGSYKAFSAKQAASKAPHRARKLFKVPTKDSTTQLEVPVTKTDSNRDQLASSGSWMTQSEDSDFESLSNTLSLSFDGSQSNNPETDDCDTDFVSLETVDCSQSFDMEE